MARLERQRSSIDSKIEDGGKEIGVGLSKVITGTCKATLNTLRAGKDAVCAGIAKIQEKLSDETDEKLINSRKVITDSHIKNLRNSGKNVLKGVGTALGGSWKTIKGTTKVTYHSMKKTVEKKPTTKKTKKK